MYVILYNKTIIDGPFNTYQEVLKIYRKYAEACGCGNISCNRMINIYTIGTIY